MRLATFLALPRPPFDYRQSDCCRWLDAWVQARGHASPMAAIGMAYDSERSALRRIREGGGLVALWSKAMGLIGVPEAATPVCGNIGIIACGTDAGEHEVAAIYTGERWVALGQQGLDFSPAQHLRAWGV